MIRRILLYISALLLFAGCSDRRHDALLERVALTVAESPEDALRALDSIDRGALAGDDRHYYDFLALKARDKAYIVHTSDSAYLSVYRYYSDRENDPLYPEVLYYGGRVYSDLGDYPSALGYFQQALDRLPADTRDIDLRNRVLSQTGRLLNSLRLYDEAVPYIKSSIDINRQLKDTLSLIYNLQLLGDTYLRANNCSLAENVFREGLGLCIKHSIPTLVVKTKMYLGAVKYKLGQIDSALSYIRHTPDNIDPIVRNNAIAYASNIYKEAGILDTAYLYSHELISSPDPLNHQIGYQVILSPELRNFVHPDTLDLYFTDYLDLLENSYDNNENQLAIIQQSLYNYRLHDREKTEAVKANAYLWRWIAAIILILIILVVVTLIQKIKDKNRIIELHQALESITVLEQELKSARNTAPIPSESKENRANEEISATIGPCIETGSAMSSERELRERLKDKLMSLYENGNSETVISSVILQSEPYRTLRDSIENGKSIKDDSPLWNELEQVVLQVSPKFVSNLNLLTLGKLTALDLHTALLIKCGIRPSEMTILLGRTNGAIISRRSTLCAKVLDKKTSVKVIDRMIRYL